MSGITTNWPKGTLLAALPEPIRAELVTLGDPQEFVVGTHLITQGERSRHVYVILDGWVKVTAHSTAGHTTLLAVRVRGDAVGELASLDGAIRSATVSAVGPVHARRIGHVQLQRFLADHPAAALGLGSYVSTKLRWATERRIEFGSFPVPVRLARILMNLVSIHGHPARGGMAIGVEVSQSELASLIGAAEPGVHRALRALKEAGVVEVGYRQFVIRDLPRLAEAAQLTTAEFDALEVAKTSGRRGR